MPSGTSNGPAAKRVALEFLLSDDWREHLAGATTALAKTNSWTKEEFRSVYRRLFSSANFRIADSETSCTVPLNADF